MEDTVKKGWPYDHHLVLWSIFFFGLALRGYGLSAQPALDDEVGSAFDAVNYMTSGMWGRIMWEHPPLRNIVIFLSSGLYGGFTAWGLRFGSILFGSLTIPVLGYLSNSLFNNRLIGYLAAFFLCIDPLHISLSRQSFQETTTSFFIVAGVLASSHAIKKDNILPCYLSGLFFGIATASKWHGLFPWAVSAAAYCFAPWFLHDREGGKRLAERIVTTSAAYIAIPLAVYVAVYIPWLNRGHSLTEFANFHLFLVKANYVHKASDYAERFLPQRAYLWFIKPLAWNDFVFSNGKPCLNVAMGNFLVWGATLPALWHSIRKWLREKEFAAGYVIAVFLLSYIPLLLTKRGIWIFNSLSVVPFAFIIVAYSIKCLQENGRVTYRMLSVYLLLAAFLSAFMYPMSTFRTLEYPILKPLVEIYSPHHGDSR